jgi:hypothetical protein
MRKDLLQLTVVMAGLDPAIHILTTGASGAGECVDARVKHAHDDLWLTAIKTERSMVYSRQMRPAGREARR